MKRKPDVLISISVEEPRKKAPPPSPPPPPPPPSPVVRRTKPATLNLIWGATAIGKELGLSDRQFYHLAESGHLPAVKKVGSKWVADRAALIQHFHGPDNEE